MAGAAVAGFGWGPRLGSVAGAEAGQVEEAEAVRLAGEVFPVAVAARVAAARAAVGNTMSLLTPKFPLDESRVVASIAAAEQRTSGEIRVVVSPQKTDTPMLAAEKQFERLGMNKTAARNGILIFVAPASHRFAVIGDRGIHEKCGATFWEDLAVAMTERFKRGDFTDALVLGIERSGALLAEHFPRRPDDRNELPDHIENAE
jgi:uncharacterized membrane protein